MTIRYVGEGGSDSANGLTWENRKLTLNGVEDTPVAAGDTVYVAPGVYREELICDVDGTSGSPITYVGDLAGANTDGIGGPVRITGSLDDKTFPSISGYNNIYTLRAYRTFRGFRFDSAVGGDIDLDHIFGPSANNCIIEDCYFSTQAVMHDDYASKNIEVNDLISGGTIIIRRCYFAHTGIRIIGVNCDVLIENCIFVCTGFGIRILAASINGDILINNCTFIKSYSRLIDVSGTLGTGSISVTNSIFFGSGTMIYGIASGMSEDYNSFFGFYDPGPVMGFSGGANSDLLPPFFKSPLLAEGYPRDWFPWELSSYSPLARIVGDGNEATDDFFGMLRPTTSGKMSRGAVQVNEVKRATTPTYSDTAESLEMPDADRQQFRIPVTATSTTITLRVYREANYAGTLPQMVIKEPGQSDRTTTDTGSVTTWNLLTDTFTPNGTAGFVVVELVSNNTATSGSYAAFWSTLTVA